MAEKVILVQDLSKVYQLGDFGTGSVTRDFERFLARVRGKEDPNLKIGEANDRTVKGGSDFVWSLKDINFSIDQGDTLGIIGRNGAGKSTLLKILSRVTAPTTGSVKVKGRIASLLEVGTGFHPELTGRENVFLNGAILGMRRSEIKRKFDEIVDFSGVERYIDTPVKRYSSGMYVRLAFAVAAYLESEILVVDEVLAVGDAEFQRKCLGKMSDISRGEGRTVLFVSHNMQAIQRLCKNCLFLADGMVQEMGNAASTVANYLKQSKTSEAIFDIPRPNDHAVLIGFATRIQVEDQQDRVMSEIPVGRNWQVRVFFRINRVAEHFIIGLGLRNIEEININTSWSKPCRLPEGNYEVVLKSSLILTTGLYQLTLGLSNYERAIHYLENVALMTISDVTDKSMDDAILKINNGLILNQMEVDIFPAKH